MMVILRPGPYVCAEWEFGGYPWWLQNIPGMEIRRDNTEFLKYTKNILIVCMRKWATCNVQKVVLSLWYSVKMSLAHTFPSVRIYRLKSTVPIMQRSKGSWLMPGLPFRCSPPMEVGCLKAGVWQVPCPRPMGRVISLILKGGEPVSW